MARKTICKCGKPLTHLSSTQCSPCKTIALRIRRAKDRELEGFNPVMQQFLRARSC